MAGYTVRSLGQLAAEAKSAFVQAVQGTAANLFPNIWRVESKVLSLLGFSMEMRRAWLVRQIFASTADQLWLIRHGFELGISPFPATLAVGSATFPVVPGTVIPAGLQFTRGDATFTTTAGATPLGTSVSLPLEADLAGSAGNTPAGGSLGLVNPDDAPNGFTGTGMIDTQADGSGLSGGAEAEDVLTAFRARVLAQKRARAQSGTAADYETWVREALGAAVLSVYVDSFQNDARSVWVAFTVYPPGVTAGDAAATLAAYQADPTTILPTPAQIAVAQAYISDPIRRPITATPYAVALTPVPVPVVIGGLAPDTPAIRASVAAEVASVFIDRAAPGLPSAPSSLSVSWFDEAVSRATGEARHRLVSPAADPTFTAGGLPVLGAITYTD